MAVFQGAQANDAALERDLATGSRYIDELFAADIIAIGAPMRVNLGIPSQLKAWVDRVSVSGRTFRYGANGPEGLVRWRKTAFVASARGGVPSRVTCPARRSWTTRKATC